MKSLDLQVLREIPQGMVELSLCGAFIKDNTLFTEMFTRLHNIRALCLCGVTALNDSTLETVGLYSVKSEMLYFDD